MSEPEETKALVPTEQGQEVDAVSVLFGSTDTGKSLIVPVERQAEALQIILNQIVTTEMDQEEKAPELVAWQERPDDTTSAREKRQVIRSMIHTRRVYMKTDHILHAASHLKAGLTLDMAREEGWQDEDGHLHTAADLLKEMEEKLGAEQKREESGRWRQIHRFATKQADWLQFELGIDRDTIVGVMREDIPSNISNVSGWLSKIHKWSKDEEEPRVTPENLKQEAEWILRQAATCSSISKFMSSVKLRYKPKDEEGDFGKVRFAYEKMPNHLRVVMELTEDQWNDYVRPSIEQVLVSDPDIWVPLPITLEQIMVAVKAMVDWKLNLLPQHVNYVIRQIIYADSLLSPVFGMMDRNRDTWLRTDDFLIRGPGEDPLSKTDVFDTLTRLYDLEIINSRAQKDERGNSWMEWMLAPDILIGK